MSVERSVSRGEARAGAEESLKKPSGERERRACASLLAPFSARRHSRGVLARHRLPPVRASGRRPNRGCIPARTGRVAVKRLAPDRQSPTSSPLANSLLSLCVVRRARVSRRCSTPRAAREGGRERERSENQRSRLVSSRLPSSRIYQPSIPRRCTRTVSISLCPFSRRLLRSSPHQVEHAAQSRTSGTLMILPQVHLRKPCYDFYFL